MPESLAIVLDRLAIFALVACGATILYVLACLTRLGGSVRWDRAPRSMRRGVVAVALLFFLGAGLAELLKGHARDVMATALAPSANPRLRIAGRPVDHSDALLAALRSMRGVWPHHSGPAGRIVVDIDSDRGSLRVELARDSQRPDELWVLVPRYWSTSMTDIARIHTGAFDGL